MFKVKIDYSGEFEDLDIITEMPLIPSKGDILGLWLNDSDLNDSDNIVWTTVEVVSVVFEFNKNHEYLYAEINVRDS